MEKVFNGVMFRLNGSTCVIDAMAVREIVGGAQWAPLTMEGEGSSFIEIRGKAARVVDLRELFGFSPASGEGLNSFIAVQVPGGDRLAALWVDTLLELVHVPAGQMRGAEGSEIPVKFVRAIFDNDGVPVHVLRTEEILESALQQRALAMENKAS